MFGKGFACSATWVSAGSCATSTTQWALLFTPEPIDSTINQAEAKLTYAKDNLLLTAGYYGNIYINRHSNITPNVTGTSLNNPLGAATALDSGLRTTLNLPLALPPDSQSHQFYLLGNYRFTPTTVANFKYAYTQATQDEDFGADGFFQAPAGPVERRRGDEDDAGAGRHHVAADAQAHAARQLPVREEGGQHPRRPLQRGRQPGDHRVHEQPRRQEEGQPQARGQLPPAGRLPGDGGLRLGRRRTTACSRRPPPSPACRG